MSSYLPLAITFMLGVIGLLVRTRRESADRSIHRLTPGGWAVLALLTTSLGIGAMLESRKQAASKLAAQQDALEHERAQRRSDSLLTQQREQLLTTRVLAAHNDTSFREQITASNDQLEYLRRLVLLQHDVSAIEISWLPRDAVRKRFLDSLDRAYREASAAGGTGRPADDTQIHYLSAAAEHGEIVLRRLADSGIQLTFVLGRPQGMLRSRIDASAPAARAFVRAIPALLGEHLVIELAPGVALADLVERDQPSEVHLGAQGVTFVVEPPGVRIGQLERARVSFRALDLDEQDAPQAITLRSRDSRLTLDQRFQVVWKRLSVDCQQSADEMQDCARQLTAGPFALAARLSESLLPPRTSSAVATRGGGIK